MPVSSLRYSSLIVGTQDYASGIRYSSSTPDILTTGASTGSSTGTLYFQPFVCTYSHTFTGLSFHNSASVNTLKFRMGIYNSAARAPSTRLLDGGEITIADTNTNTLRELTISQALNANTLYWLAWCCDTNSPSVIVPASFARGDQLCEFGSAGFPSGTPGSAMWFKMTQAYGALPANASSLSPSIITSGGMPLMFVKG